MTELAETVAALARDVENLRGWQKSQNGAIHRVEDHVERVNTRIEKLQYWIMGQLAAVVMLALSIWLSR